MRWRRSPGDRSGIEDRRRSGGGGGRIPGGRIGGGVGGVGLVGVIVALLVVFLGGGGGRAFDIGPSLDPFPAAPAATEDAVDEGPDQLRDFVAFVVTDVQNAWAELFEAAGGEYGTYQRTQLVLFTGAVASACGTATAATGPFYCPADQRVYLDLGFFRELERRFGAPGDFAQAYVIAHEFGHHVHNLLGIMAQVQAAQRAAPDDANELSVRLELQADCLAGVWAHTAYREGQLEEGDLEEGLNAAAAVGDDRIQQQATGRVDRETFTHGSSEERQSWFLRGFQEGSVASCDTFS